MPLSPAGPKSSRECWGEDHRAKQQAALHTLSHSFLSPSLSHCLPLSIFHSFPLSLLYVHGQHSSAHLWLKVLHLGASMFCIGVVSMFVQSGTPGIPHEIPSTLGWNYSESIWSATPVPQWYSTHGLGSMIYIWYHVLMKPLFFTMTQYIWFRPETNAKM